MSRINVRTKGQSGEREVIKILQPVVIEVYEQFGLIPPDLERNLMQSMKGGHDIIGLDWMALEVKRQETLSISNWWDQAKTQSKIGQEPILIYRQSHRLWRVMMFGFLPAGASKIRCPVDINLESFLLYFKYRLIAELTK
jgi:hypothetical protein